MEQRSIDGLAEAHAREVAASTTLHDAVEALVEEVCTEQNIGIGAYVNGSLYEVVQLTWPSEIDGVTPDPVGAITLLRRRAALVDVRPDHHRESGNRLAIVLEDDYDTEYDTPVAANEERVAFVADAEEVMRALRQHVQARTEWLITDTVSRAEAAERASAALARSI
jgi:hypothetical protein